MLYQLVLITNLGVMTPIHTYPDMNACISAQAMIPKTAQSSASCLPTDNADQLKSKIERSNTITLDAVKNITGAR
jgi:hypothetical protein